MSRNLALAGAVLALGLVAGPAQAQVYTDKEISRAVDRSLPLMQSSGVRFQQVMGKVCFSCHHQSLPALAYATASGRGFKLDETVRKSQSDFVYEFVAKAKPLLAAVDAGDAQAEAKVDRILVDPSVSMVYALFGLEQDGRQPDETLNLAAKYLAKKQAADGRWPVYASRPPLEGSEFASTALAVRGLKTYAPAEQQEDTDRRVAAARDWLVRSLAKSTEDKAFRLLGLKWSAAPDAEIRKATQVLLDEQRDDGGWGQLPGKGSDAYSTGQVLYALRHGAGMAVKDSTYTRGATYLLLSQQPDGSWKVAKRAIAAQPYFESKFPHKKDQYISISGTAWATAALAETVERRQQAAR